MDPRNIRIENFTYPLPDDRIAKHPLAQRDACRLLKFDGSISDHIFSELPALLPQGSMLVYNNTRVINARLRFTKTTGAKIEIFCLEPLSPADYERSFASRGECSWICLVGNSKRWKEGMLTQPLSVGNKEVMLHAERMGQNPNGAESMIRFSWDDQTLTFSDIIAAAGEIPIPPYLNRESEKGDSTDYQTVYSHIEGSVAAPTAGLHFTPELLDRLRCEGFKTREVTLHVGAGTFKPVSSDTIGEHDMHSEFIAVKRDFIAELAETIGKSPVIAVGTTSVRTLESLYHIGVAMLNGSWNDELDQWAPYAEHANDAEPREALRAIVDYLDRTGQSTFYARTRIIIAPSYRYRIVNGMITNFHQPQSTLLLLVSALIGEQWKNIYAHALDNDYRFLSYGDACLLFPNTQLHEKN
ncbi:MAG: S-adenosylmethionine:tRNA ribosyltransferase-isomerase [Bacteroidales bacterium]|nr:S-adenosylmethionine:tRNA ribosyltransferase-isomerase [Bacteroidales bacterium]